MAAARYWRAIGLQAWGGGALELSALHLYSVAGYRYWRLTNITIPSAYMEISELQLTYAGAKLAGGTLTASTNPSYATLADINDNNTSTRCQYSQATVQAPGFWLQIDYGVPVSADGIRQAGFDTSGRHLSGFTLSASNDASEWVEIATFSGLAYPGNYTYSPPYAFTPPGAAQDRLDVSATISSTIPPSMGSVAALQDTDTASLCRWEDLSASGFAVQWDFGGSPQEVGSVRVGSGATQTQFLECLILQSSANGLAWSGGVAFGGFAWPGANAMSAIDAAPLPLRVRPTTAGSAIHLSGGAPGPTKTVLASQPVATDMQDGGLYRLYGTVELAGTPNLLLRRRVELWNQRDKRLVRESWSDAITGAWSFDRIRGGDGTRYSAVTYDHTGQKQAAIADNLEPEAM